MNKVKNIVIVLLILGWLLNIVKTVPMVKHGMSTLYITRVLGVPLFPLGGIVGWIPNPNYTEKE